MVSIGYRVAEFLQMFLWSSITFLFPAFVFGVTPQHYTSISLYVP